MLPRSMKTAQQEQVMKIIESRKMLAWAVPKKDGFAGEAPGLYFYYYGSEVEAEKTRRVLKRQNKFTGPVEYRPRECWQLGSVAL